MTASGDEVCNGTNYKDLETFQKAQLRQKVISENLNTKFFCLNFCVFLVKTW